jgi:CheY-specific phosphatase CheX
MNLQVEVGSVYIDDGASATDNIDGDITTSIVATGIVDTSVPGQYVITYNVSDTAGNAATAISRTVTVVDTTAPVLVLVGDAAITVEQGTTYSESGATASDNFEGDITANVLISGTVDINIIGSYIITYSVSDTAGNAATAISRTVNVVDTTAPEVMSTEPTNAQSDVQIDIVLTASFNEPLLDSSVTSSTVLLSDSNSNNIAGQVSLSSSGTLISFTPDASLTEGIDYVLTLTTGISDLSANTLAADVSVQFTTVTTPQMDLPVLIDDASSPVGEPQYAANSTGNGIAAWRQGGTIFANRYNKQTGWQGVEQVSDAPMSGVEAFKDVKIDINDNGNMVAVWTQSEPTAGVGGARIFARRYTDASGWGPIQALSAVDGINEAANAGMDAAGNILVIWRYRQGFQADGQIRVRRFDNLTQNWDPAWVIEGDNPDPDVNDNALNPKIAVNSMGQALAIWVSGIDVVANFFDPSTLWSGNNILNSGLNVNVAQNPEISLDDNANAIAVWTQRLVADSQPNISASHFTLANAWGPVLVLETSQLGESRYPQIVMNNNHAIALWTAYDGVAYSLYTSRYDATNQWESPVLMESNDFNIFQSTDGGVSIAMNDGGNSIVAWNQRIVIPETQASESRIIVSKRDLTSSAMWSAPMPLPQAELSTEAYMPSVAIGSDGSGNVVSQQLLLNSLDMQSHSID